jgi:ribonuclease BN (tRNA processing enzyme)
MSLFSIRCLGVGDGLANADRNHSSYLYEIGGTSLLIDCGEPVSRSFKASGLGYDSLDAIFLSHLHSDHFAGFLMLMQSFWLEKRSRELTVHLPADALVPVRDLLKSVYLFPELLPFALKFERLRARQSIQVGGVRVTPFPTTHLEQLKRRFQSRYAGDYEAFCFLLEAAGLRLVHTCDLGAPEDLEPVLNAPVDTLVCEISHFAPEALFEFLKGRELRRLALVHISRPFWDKRDALLEEARRMLPKVSVSIAKDGEVLKG